MKTIGEVLDALEQANDESAIYFAFGHCVPGFVDSWRGIYAEAALGFGDGRYGSGHLSIGDFKKRLLMAISGAEYDGWKGGNYRYDKSTPLHIDNRGISSHTEIDRIEITGYGSAFIHTCTEE